MAPSVQRISDSVFTVTSDKGVSLHASTRPAMPYPVRSKRDDVGLVDGKSFANHLRQFIGLGKWPALYVTHDMFIDESGVSPLTSELKCLCRINLSGTLEVHEEEIIYNPIEKVEFQYWMSAEDHVISHSDMMTLIYEKRDLIPKKIIDAFVSIDSHLVGGLNTLYVGKYPREIWEKLDIINAARKVECFEP